MGFNERLWAIFQLRFSNFLLRFLDKVANIYPNLVCKQMAENYLSHLLSMNIKFNCKGYRNIRKYWKRSATKKLDFNFIRVIKVLLLVKVLYISGPNLSRDFSSHVQNVSLLAVVLYLSSKRRNVSTLPVLVYIMYKNKQLLSDIKSLSCTDLFRSLPRL